MVLSGCSREEIAVYEAPKDSAPSPASPHSGAPPTNVAEGMPPRPGLRWKSLPEGWTSRPASGMRVANIAIAGANNAQADLAVIPLPGTGGSDVELVNLWRSQLGLPPISEAELPSHTDETTVAGQPVRLFSIVGSAASDAAASGNQILVAALRRDGFTWFFKLGGDSATVLANREPLKAFLGQVEFTAPEAQSPAMAAAPMASPPFASGGGGPGAAGAAPSGPAPKPKWEVPPAWQSQTAPQMVHSKWTVASPDGATADVTVSVFPGEVGGLVPNLNRWRSQVGLPPAQEPELTALRDNLDVLGGKATLADFAGNSPAEGTPSRLVGAVVRRDGYSWFYKLLGSPKAVEAQRETFLKFIQSAQYTRGS